ncbi:MAG: DNA repair protein RecN, partial [Clostridia bacterium]|nr:DNA repair protein RecN [Clostridia bacterium]
YAFVEGCFGDIDDNTAKKLAEYDVSPDEDGLVFISRRISSDGKGVSKINGATVPASRLKAVSMHLIDIHGQQDTQSMSDEKTQLSYLDLFADSGRELSEYQGALSLYREKKRELDRLRSNEEDKEFRIEMLRMKVGELKKACVKKGEEAKLEADCKRLRNIEKISSSASAANKLLYGSAGACEYMYKAQSLIDKLTEYVPEASELSSRLESARLEAEDIASTLSEYADTDGNSLEMLEKAESRLALINSLKRKYKKDADGLNELCEELEKELDSLLASGEMIADIEKEAEKLYKELKEKARALTERRKAAKERLCRQTEEALHYLDMPKFVFDITVSEKEPSDDGADTVKFMISANEGEELRPIEKTASGGELSRFILSLKSVFAEKNETPTMIFDEIDTGISGKTARKTGIMLKKLAKNNQVLCVTHSAQIASLAENHLLVSKRTDDGRTKSGVKLLDEEGRINELARIIGGISISDTVLAAARELYETGKSV